MGLQLPAPHVFEGIRRELDPVETFEFSHPHLVGVTLVVWVYPEHAEVAWLVEQFMVWQGSPAEA